MEQAKTLNNGRTNRTQSQREIREKANNYSSEINVHGAERLASSIGGGALAAIGVAKGGLSGLGLMVLGGGLLWRGVRGHCQVYETLGINTSNHTLSHTAVRHGRGIKVEKSITIDKSPTALFQYWRNFENLPRFMAHLEKVQILDESRSRWVAKAILGTTVEWEAEIINLKNNELIAWQTIPGASVPNAGSVRFEPKSSNGGTIVRVELNYEPPGGTIGATIAKLFGAAPEQQIEADLMRFKQIMETGETASTKGQATGRSAGGRTN